MHYEDRTEEWTSIISFSHFTEEHRNFMFCTVMYIIKMFTSRSEKSQHFYHAGNKPSNMAAEPSTHNHGSRWPTNHISQRKQEWYVDKALRCATKDGNRVIVGDGSWPAVLFWDTPTTHAVYISLTNFHYTLYAIGK